MSFINQSNDQNEDGLMAVRGAPDTLRLAVAHGPQKAGEFVGMPVDVADHVVGGCAHDFLLLLSSMTPRSKHDILSCN